MCPLSEIVHRKMIKIGIRINKWLLLATSIGQKKNTLRKSDMHIVLILN